MLTRRRFVSSVGLGAAGAMTASWISARGREDAVWSILDPRGLLTRVADLLGVGRAADRVLYGLVLGLGIATGDAGTPPWQVAIALGPLLALWAVSPALAHALVVGALRDEPVDRVSHDGEPE